MTIRMTLAVIAILFGQALKAGAQENPGESQEPKRKHKVAISIAHAFMQAISETGVTKQTLVIPTVGANYELWLNDRWAAGLHNDISMAAYKIEKSASRKMISRDYPVLTTLVAIYKPGEHWNFFAGPGREFEKNESFYVIKTGVEFGLGLPKSFEVNLGAEFDRKLRGYSSWLVGIGISKLF